MALFADPRTSTPVTSFDGVILKRLLAGALAWFEQYYEQVNLLNVFPVPDGDTGTNLLLTVRNAYKEIADNPSASVGVIAVRFAHGALRGSRGNSGTILSEMLRGFANELSSHQTADAGLTARAFREATRLAYAVVQQPVEGTILTVARETADAIDIAIRETPDLREVLHRASIASQRSVAHTPDLLPILRKAGVVDSGGQGLAYLFEGMWRAAIGEELIPNGNEPKAADRHKNFPVGSSTDTGLRETLKAADPLGYGYDVQFVIRGYGLNIDAVRNAIGQMGDSMVVVGDAQMIKVHIHVHDPGIPISYGAKLGVLEDVVVENMQAQSEAYISGRESDDLPIVTVQSGEIAVIAIAPGLGLQRVFRGVGAALVIDGGQTMNPSSGELIDAINKINTDRVVLLPNNKNIQLTAEQAAKAVTGKQVQVVPTRTVPQGIAALLAFSADGDLETVVMAMTDARIGVATGEVTTATRSIQLNGVNVEEGEIIGLIDGVLAVSGKTVQAVVKDLLAQMKTDQHELVTLYYGAEVMAATAKRLVEELSAEYPDQEFEVFEGGQPHYYYILSVE